MKFINYLIEMASGPYDPYTKLAAALCLLCMIAASIGGTAVIINGLYWSYKNWQYEKMLRNNQKKRLPRLGLL